jgi:hypothetical protein
LIRARKAFARAGNVAEVNLPGAAGAGRGRFAGARRTIPRRRVASRAIDGKAALPAPGQPSGVHLIQQSMHTIPVREGGGR